MSRKQREQDFVHHQKHKAILNEEAVISSSIKTTAYIKPATVNQALYVKSIKNNVVTLVVGKAGTGKSLLALHTGVNLLNNPNSPINKIFYLRANVGMNDERDIGFLPGELADKIAPLAYPVLDNLSQFMTEEQAKYFLESNKIEVLPIAFIRGRSFRNAFVFGDEMQNLTSNGIKTVLTRIGENTKMVLAGDCSQVDIKESASGLRYVSNALKELDNVGTIEMYNSDIVRHPIIPHILSRLE